MADNKGINTCKCGNNVREQSDSIENQSFAMMMLHEASRNARRWFTVAMTILVMWLSTIVLFVWYLNQYEVTGEEYIVEQNTDGGGYIADSYVGVNGDIIHGLPENKIN